MKLLLISPSSKQGVKSLFLQTEGEGIGHKPPLGLLYIASYIKKYSSHKTEVLDMESRPLDDGELVKQITRINPDVVGITCWTDFWYPVWRLMDIIKGVLPKVHIVLGGPHVWVYPSQTLLQRNVDSIILGDGEVPTLSLLNYLESGQPLIKEGVYLKSNGLPEQFLFYVEKDLDHLPFPDRNLLPFEDYTSVLASGPRITTMITSRGCPNRCIFCKLHFQIPVCRSASNVLDEMEEINKLDIHELEIYDDTFTWSEKRLVQICEGIIKRGIRLKWAIRDRVTHINEKTLELMKKAGCNRVHLGIESGNPAILKRTKKNITLEQVTKAVTLTKKVGFKILTYYMIGLPGETKEHVKETIQFAVNLDSDYAEFNITIPYPGTEMYNEGILKGIIPLDFWEKFACTPTPDFMMPYLYEEFLKKSEMIELRNFAIKKFYFRPKVLFRELRNCSSLQEFTKKSRMGLSLLTHSFIKER